MIEGSFTEIPVTSHSFDNKLRDQYGVDFWQSYHSSKNYRPNEQLKPSHLPGFSEIEPILERATSFKLVEWKGGQTGDTSLRLVRTGPTGKENTRVVKFFDTRIKDGYKNLRILMKRHYL